MSEPCRLRRGEGYAASDDAGHAENPYNNRCDQLAVAESQKYR